MCPVCLATAVLIAGGALSSGGLAVIAIRRFGGGNAVDDGLAQAGPKSFEKRTEQ
jgi:hypothetical protein